MPQFSTRPISQSEAVPAVAAGAANINKELLMADVGVSSIADPQQAYFSGDQSILSSDDGQLRNLGLRAIGKKVTILAFIVVALFLSRIPLQAQPSPPSRPILFVHGWCGSAFDFAPLLSNAYPSLPSDLYPSPTIYYAAYAGNQVAFSTPGNGTGGPIPIAEYNIPPSARFFSIEFYNPDKGIDSVSVAEVSILNKANELSQVIKHITAITHIKDVIVIAHSMGGLVARAYVEDLASAGKCYDNPPKQDSNGNEIPDYSASTCKPGSVSYAGDIGDIITVDTPHQGAPVKEETPWWSSLAVDINPAYMCQFSSSVNKTELQMLPDGSGLLEVLNYSGTPSPIGIPTKLQTPIQAIEDYFDVSGSSQTWDGIYGESDDIVDRGSQSLGVIPPSESDASLDDVPVGYTQDDSEINQTSACWTPWVPGPPPGIKPMMHPMTCLGALTKTYSAIATQANNHAAGTLTEITVQATLDGNPWSGAVSFGLQYPSLVSLPTAETTVPLGFADVPLGTYSIVNVTGGPPSTNPPTIKASPNNATIQSGQWAVMFTIAFTSTFTGAQNVTTLAATQLTSIGVQLNGRVNTNGSTGFAYFQFSQDPTLSSGLLSTSSVPLSASTTAQLVSINTGTQGALPNHTTYYYQAAFNDSGSGKTYYGNVLSFTTSTNSTSYTLTVNSSNPFSGVRITASPTDNDGGGSGTTSFVLTYNQNSLVTLTAPSTISGNNFWSWTGCDQVLDTTCTVSMTASRTVTANAVPRYSESVLYNFNSAANGTDGYFPMAGLILDSAGNLYGTTQRGARSYLFNGPNVTYGGNVFKVDSTGHETVLYGFCSALNCTDGNGPASGLIQDSAGNLYGTTPWAGASSAGNVFKVDSTGHETVLYSFCAVVNPAGICTDGVTPQAGLILDAAGNVYGTTVEGGANPIGRKTGGIVGLDGNAGTVFKVDNTGHETVLYSFCSVVNSAGICTDGEIPYAGLLRDAAGNLYGTTMNGGEGLYFDGLNHQGGTVFRVDSTGHETVLYSFCSALNCTDGSAPMASLILDAAGNLYGTTQRGGAGGATAYGGTVFRVDSTGHETVLYSFCSALNCADGSTPKGNLIQDAAGNLYGTTESGGAYGMGVVYMVDIEGHETVLYSFCSALNCTDGNGPASGLIQDAAGNLYGTTIGGGIFYGKTNTGYGTVFKLTPVMLTPQTISFPNPGPLTYGVGPITLSATASSDLPVSFAVIAGPATVSGDNLIITGTGAVTVMATQAGNASYAAATPVSVTFIVNSATPAITVSPASAAIYVGNTKQFSATGTYSDSSTRDLTGTVGWISSNTSVATIDTSGLTTAVASGTTIISASLNGVSSNTAALTVLSGNFTAPTGPVGTASGTQTATILLSSSFTLGSISVVTQGAPNLDFNIAPGGTCNVGTAYTGGQTCTVNFTFTPKAPGQRMGAIVIADGSGNTEGTEYITGVGTGPLVGFSPSLVTTVAGNGASAYSGDGIAAPSASIGTPEGSAVDSVGNIYIADGYNNRIRKVSASTGLISTVAGNGIGGFSGDGSVASRAELNNPRRVSVDGAGNLYFVDFMNDRIRKVSASTGQISTVAGNGIYGYNSDGIAATSAELAGASDVAVDSAGNIYIADFDNSRIRKVSASTGQISTVAGNGTFGYNGDGIAATSAELYYPFGVAVDSTGNIYIADQANSRIRKVSASTGQISTVAGNGYIDPDNTSRGGYNSDGIAATSAELNWPTGVAVDSAGNIFIADFFNNRIREVSVSTGLINTVAGNGTQGYNGDGIAAANAELYYPIGVALDSGGNIYIADEANQRIRKVNVSEVPSLSFATTAVGSTSSDSPQTVALSNNGNTALTFPIPSSGNNPSISANFTLNTTGGTACPLIGSTASLAGTLAAGASCTLPISFAPTAGGSISGSLGLTDNTLNVLNATQTITLSGTGTGGAINTTTTLGSSDNPSSYGQSVTITATVTATSGTSTPTGTVQFSVYGSSAGSAITLSGGIAAYTTSTLAAGTHSITAVYFPGTGSAFTTSSATALSQTVNKATPTITWAMPSAISYGTALSATQLNATAGYNGSTVAGTFAYTPANGAVLAARLQTLSVTFTPTDGTDYASATQTVQLTVDKAPLSVTVNNQSMPYGGTVPTLSGTLSGVVGSDGITASYATTGTTSSPAGTYPITATLNDPNSKLGNYTGTNTPGTFTIGKATTTITWPVPAAITYGTLLSATQLNATASYNGSTVAGTFAYTPANGAVLTAGLQTLSVTFTPTDTTDYTVATQTVQLTVTKATPTLLVTASGSPSIYGGAVTFTAAVSSGPTGLVTFYDGSASIGTGIISGTSATFTTSTLTGGPHTITAGWAGNINYNSITSNSITQTVNKATPTITWAPPAAITYGTPLSGTQLNASSTVAGTYAYSPAASTVLGAGTQTLSVTFTPTDATDYTSAGKTVSLAVNKATLAVTASSPTVAYGSAVPAVTPAYSGYQNGDTASVLTTAPTCTTTYTPNTKVNATPPTTSCSGGAVTSNYSFSYVGGTVTVTQAIPTLTWITPSAITYGMALSVTQLNATSTVAGSFAYTPTLGTVLGAGAQTLSVAFIPTDSTDYAIATQTVTSTVNKAPLAVTANNRSMTYGGTVPTLTGTLTGVVGSDGITASYATTATSSSTAGTYSITATLNDPNSKLGNYTVTNTPGLLTNGKATPSVTWAMPTAITYGTALSATQLNATSTVAGSFAYTPALGTILSVGAQTLSVTFTPTDMIDYMSGSKTVSLVVNKATPSLVLTCAEVVYDGNPHTCSGTATGLSAVAVGGNWNLSPASEISAGSYAVTATFTSTDPNYAGGAASGTLKINKATPTITWPTLAAITFGTALTGSQLNATSTTPGSFAYAPTPGAVLAAGSQTLSVTLTPTDLTDYSSATKTVSLTVNQASSTITWATPSPITYGTALSALQLDATASVPGTFLYNPAAGTIPPVGNDTLSVRFTPTDSTDYSTATATVTLTVNSSTNPVPVISNMSPAFASAGGATFMLTVNGLGFATNSTVYWGTTTLATQYRSSTQLTAQVPESDTAAAGSAAITVQTPAPSGGTSNSLQFEVDSSPSGTTSPIFTLSAMTVLAGSPAAYPVTLPSAATSVTVTCLNLPAGVFCSYSSGAKAVFINTSSTTTRGTYQITVVFAESLPGATSALVLLPILLLPVVIAKRRGSVGRIWLAACLGIILMVAAVSVGCVAGGRGVSSSLPAPATHQVTSSGSVTLTVQ